MSLQKTQELTKKIALLDKQLAWEKLRSEALDTMINIAENNSVLPSEKSLDPNSSGNKKDTN